MRLMTHACFLNDMERLYLKLMDALPVHVVLTSSNPLSTLHRRFAVLASLNLPVARAARITMS